MVGGGGGGDRCQPLHILTYSSKVTIAALVLEPIIYTDHIIFIQRIRNYPTLNLRLGPTY